MAGFSLKHLILGFIAGAIATVTVHELINLAILRAGVDFPRQPWSMDPVTIKFGASTLAEIPRIASDTFWGGVWGMVFAVILGAVPKGSMTLKGILLGLIGPALLGVFILVPVIKGGELFLGGNQTAIGCVLLILAGFGAATAWLYGFLTSGCRLP
jgi:hypothetical protein